MKSVLSLWLSVVNLGFMPINGDESESEIGFSYPITLRYVG